MAATHIIATGPESGGISRVTGDEFPVWFVFAADDDGEPVGKEYRLSSFRGAVELAGKMSRDRRLPLTNEASGAW